MTKTMKDQLEALFGKKEIKQLPRLQDPVKEDQPDDTGKTWEEVMAEVDKEAGLHKEPPIPCKGYRIHSVDGDDYDCEYDHAGEFGCEDCIVNGGPHDPRIGIQEEDCD